MCQSASPDGAWRFSERRYLIDLVGDVSQLRMADSKHRVEITEMLWPVGSLATKIVLAVGLVLHLMALFAWDVGVHRLFGFLPRALGANLRAPQPGAEDGLSRSGAHGAASQRPLRANAIPLGFAVRNSRAALRVW